MAKTDRNLGWPGFFRVFAVLCAIMLLIARSGLEETAAGTGAWQVFSVYQGITLWSVPALFMLWGMFALEGGKWNVSGAMLRLALPAFGALVVWGAVYAVVSHLLLGGALTWGGIWRALVSAARGNTYFHLWVLYPLIGLYLVHPVIQRFTASAARGEVIYFLALCFLFASLLPVCLAFWPGNPLFALLERLQVHLVLGWVGCYVGGWYLRHYTIGRVSEFALYVLGIVGMALTLTGNAVFGGGTALWQSYTAPNVVLTAAAFCTLFRYVLGVSEERSRRRAVNRLGSVAFGVYLFHQIWVLLFRWLDVPVEALSPVLGVPFFAVVFFLLSIPFAWLVGLIPGVGGHLT